VDICSKPLATHHVRLVVDPKICPFQVLELQDAELDLGKHDCGDEATAGGPRSLP
jgi:hypothetical protein